MSDINVSKIQQQIQTFKAQNPEIVKGLSDKKIASIMIEQGKLPPDAIKKISIMSYLENSPQTSSIQPQQQKETNFSGSQLASEMIKIASSNLPWEKSISTTKFQEALEKMEKLSTNELISFIKSFKKDGFSVNIFGGEIGDKEESIIELICDEFGENIDVKNNACRKVFNAIKTKAEKLNINTEEFETQFGVSITKETRKDINDTQKMDDIINALVQAIENRQNLTQEDISLITNTSQNNRATQTTNILNAKLKQAYESFGERIDENGEFTNKNEKGELYQGQTQQDGWAGRSANDIKEFFNSENSASNIRAHLSYAKEEIDELNKAQKNGNYAQKFEEIFGVKYDYTNIVAYQKAEQQYILASQKHEEEIQFNEKYKALLREGPLRKEVERIDAYDVNHATYITKNTKEEVFEREYKNLLEYTGTTLLTQAFKNNNMAANVSLNQQIEFLRNLAEENSIKLETGDISEENFKKEFDIVSKKLGEKALNQLFEKNGVLNGTQEQKFEVMKKLAKDTSENLHKNTMSVTNGKDFSEIQRAYENSYSAAYGINNDIMKKVTDYTVSQQIGAGLIKTGVIIGTTIAATVATGGAGGAVMLGAISAGTSAVTEISDKATNEIDNKKDLFNASSAWNITVDSAIAGVSAGAGGKATDLIWKSNAGKFAKYIKTGASDIGIGTVASGGGLIAKGQNLSDMTADEIFMNTLFAAAGGMINMATSKTVYTSLNGKKSFQTANANDITNRLAKEGRLIKSSYEQQHHFDLTSINKGKDLTTEQLVILDKVLNSNAKFTTEEINNLLTIKNPADLDTKIANLTPFKPQKGKEAIIEENGVIQINTNSPKVVINYLIKRGYFQNKEIQLNLGQILSINNKQPLTRGQIAVLNEVVNTKFKKTWDNKINYPRVSELDKLLSLQDADLAKAIIKKAELYLFDEPFSALDEKSKNELGLLVKVLSDKMDTPFIYVTHNLQEAIRLGNVMMVMNDSKIMQIDEPFDIINNPKNDFVKDFISFME